MRAVIYASCVEEPAPEALAVFEEALKVLKARNAR
jgi:hypothetical protein